MAALHIFHVTFEQPDRSAISFASEARSMADAIRNVERYAPNAVAVRVESNPTRSIFVIEQRKGGA